MTDNLLKTQAFKLKGRLYTLTVLQLLETDRTLFENYLSEVVVVAPRLFERTPVVLDCSNVASDQIDLSGLCEIMRQRGIIPVGIQGGSAFLNTVAQAQGLAVLNASASQDKSLALEDPVEVAPPPPAPAPVETIRTKLLTTPVRSGQQVVSKGGDLVITASVSHGAELLADGNIHVYGTLRGRALAGISGDKQARIFCQSLEAEMIFIAGIYCLSDAIKAKSGPCQIFLQDDRIQIESL